MKIMRILPVMVLVVNMLFVASAFGQKQDQALREGMVYIKGKPFMMGPNDESVLSAQKDDNRMITVSDFWMDAREVSNAQYREFVNWVRDSIAMRKLIEYSGEDSEYVNASDVERGVELPRLNWDKRGNLQKEYNNRFDPESEAHEALNDMFYDEGYGSLKTNKLHYDYVWVNIEEAAKPGNRFDVAKGKYPAGASVRKDTFYLDEDGGIQRDTKTIPLTQPKDLESNVIICVYPDTLVWARDFEGSYNDPLLHGYFTMPCYKDYPVVGVTWEQAMAYCDWLTKRYRSDYPTMQINPFRLPTEAEWEYAARGGLRSANYPWGNEARPTTAKLPLANFKSGRGMYNQDDGVTTTRCGSYPENGFRLLDMAGNVAEWTSSTYIATLNAKSHDINPSNVYMAREDDPAELKRKVVKGGSWKDIAYYLQCGVRTYEYQGECRSYIGFRCVRSYAGVAPRQKGDR